MKFINAWTDKARNAAQYQMIKTGEDFALIVMNFPENRGVPEGDYMQIEFVRDASQLAPKDRTRFFYIDARCRPWRVSKAVAARMLRFFHNQQTHYAISAVKEVRDER